MSNLNRTTLIGRLGKDPQITTFPNGNRCANFSLATSMKWKDAQGNAKEETEWHHVVIYGKTVEIVEQYVHKGDLLYVEGRGRTRTYTDNGVEKSIHETIVAAFEGQVKLFPKPKQQTAPAQPEWCQPTGEYRKSDELPPSDIQPAPMPKIPMANADGDPVNTDIPF